MLIGFFLGMIIGIVYGVWLAWNDYKMNGEPPVMVSSCSDDFQSSVGAMSPSPVNSGHGDMSPTANEEKYITIELKEVKHEY